MRLGELHEGLREVCTRTVNRHSAVNGAANRYSACESTSLAQQEERSAGGTG